MSDPIKFSRRSFLVIPLALAACKPSPSVIEISGHTMGTTYNVTAVPGSRPVDQVTVKAAVEAALSEVNRQMSNWDSGSEISRFNAQAGTDVVSVSKPVADLIRTAEDVYTASEGRFDITMGPLIELWGFGAPGSREMPSEAALGDAMARIGHDRVLEVGAGSVRKMRSDAQVYLAAIGKGYGADRVGQALEELGFGDYMIEIGGDLYASGRNPAGQPWQIGIETPTMLNNGVFDVVGVSGMGLASSGDYRNYFERNGERYSHVIDPSTGRPVTHKTASATVLAENSMLADAWATAMLVLGREKGLEIAEAHNIAVLFIEKDDKVGVKQFKAAASGRFKALI